MLVEICISISAPIIILNKVRIPTITQGRGTSFLCMDNFVLHGTRTHMLKLIYASGTCVPTIVEIDILLELTIQPIIGVVALPSKFHSNFPTCISFSSCLSHWHQ